MSSHPGQPGKYSCPSLFPRSLLTFLLPFKLATVTANHALVSCVSRCRRLLFSKAAAVNLSFPEWEGRREWPGGRPQLTSSHLLAQAAFARRLNLYIVGLCSSGGARQLHKELGGRGGCSFANHAHDVCTVNKTSHPALIAGGGHVGQTPVVISCCEELSNIYCLVEDGNANQTNQKIKKKLNTSFEQQM